MVSVSSLGKSKGLPQPNTQQMLNTVSGLSGALLVPCVPRPVPKPLLKSNPAPHIKKLLEAPGVPAPAWQGHLSLPVLGTVGCLPQWKQLPHAPHAWSGAMRDRELCRGLQGNMDTGWGNWEGTAPPAKAAQPGRARLACPPGAGGSPGLVAHVSSSRAALWGGGQTEGWQRTACTRAEPAEPQLPGGSTRAPLGSSCHVCSCYTPTPGAPSRHILCIPHQQPAPPRSQAVAHDAAPSSHSPGSLQEPVLKGEHVACQG